MLNPRAVTALNPLRRCKNACPIILHYMGTMISHQERRTKKTKCCPKKRAKNPQKKIQNLKF